MATTGGAGQEVPPCPRHEHLSNVSGRMLVFSGGSAPTALARHMSTRTHNVTYVLPISDNGGSSLEIMRVLGGPAIGDIRHRLLSLAREKNPDVAAVVQLLSHRLGPDSRAAKQEWQDIVEGRHALWDGITQAYKHIVRAYLVHFASELLRTTSVDINDASDAQGRVGDPFDFARGSIGNFFFTGARLFFKSLPSAICLWSFIADIPEATTVLPVVNYNQRLTLGAELQDGGVIYGQNAISHPGRVVEKHGSGAELLRSPIRRMFYLNNYQHEVQPPVTARVLQEIALSRLIVYSMGSLYTSIVPCLILQGVGEQVARNACPKVLCINGYTDRETAGMTAGDCVSAIARALRQNETEETLSRLAEGELTQLVTHVFVCEGCTMDTSDLGLLADLGLTVQRLAGTLDEGERPVFEPEALCTALLDLQRS